MSNPYAEKMYDENAPQLLRVTGTDANGLAINITEANVMQGGMVVDRCSCLGNKLEIGTAIADELTLKLDNRQGQFDNYVFSGVELYVEIGVVNPYDFPQPVTIWEPQGYFIIERQPRTASVITLTGLNRMILFDKPVPVMSDWADSDSNNLVDSDGNSLVFTNMPHLPCSANELMQYVASACGVELGNPVNPLNHNGGVIISKLPDYSTVTTYRQYVQWLAEFSGTCAHFNRTNGKLYFDSYPANDYAASAYISTPAKRYSSDLFENDITFTGVKYIDPDGYTTYISGEDGYVLDISRNPLVEGISIYKGSICQGIWNEWVDYSYRPMTAVINSAPWLDPLSVITFTDKDGNDHYCALTSVRVTLNGNTVIESKGMDETTNDLTYQSQPTQQPVTKSATFQTLDGKTITVLNGMIISIV